MLIPICQYQIENVIFSCQQQIEYNYGTNKRRPIQL